MDDTGSREHVCMEEQKELPSISWSMQVACLLLQLDNSRNYVSLTDSILF